MKKDRYFWGILFILAGIALVISKMGMFAEVNAFTLVVTFFMGVIIVKSIPKLEFGGVLFPLAIIAIMYDDQLGITSLTPWTVLLSATLGTIGLSMIFKTHHHHFWDNHGNWKGKDVDIYDSEDGGHVRFERNFSGSIKYINSDQFEEADIECNFGSMKVYFDHATMKNERAKVTLDVNFSGVEIYLPKHWRLENNVKAAFGSITEKNTSSSSNTTNTLVLLGSVNFGAIEIYYI